MLVRDPQIGAAAGAGSPSYAETGDEQLTTLVGRAVIAANAIVSDWAMLYAAISGHSLAYTAWLFDRLAREDVQRARLAKLAGDFLHKLPGALDQVESLLSTAKGLAHERDLLVGQPWSLGDLDDDPVSNAALMSKSNVALEREAQFGALLFSLQELHREIVTTVNAFRVSRDVEKIRVLNRSAVLAAEFKFVRKMTRSASGPRHKDWHASTSA